MDMLLTKKLQTTVTVTKEIKRLLISYAIIGIYSNQIFCIATGIENNSFVWSYY